MYLQPWVGQMETQMRAGTGELSETFKEIKSVLRAFIKLTYEKPQVFRLGNSSNFSWDGILTSGQQSANRLN